MAVNAFLTFFDKADGESIQKGKEKWIEIQNWDWEIEAETSWTKGGGASVVKTVKIEYKAQDNKTGKLTAPKTYNWDIPAGTTSPSA